MGNGGSFYYVLNRNFEIEGLGSLFLWKRKGKLAYLGYLWYNERVINHNGG